MGKSSWFYLGALFSHLRYCSGAANLILEPLQKKNPLVLIAIGAIVGGGLEYFAAGMETFGASLPGVTSIIRLTSMEEPIYSMLWCGAPSECCG